MKSVAVAGAPLPPGAVGVSGTLEPVELAGNRVFCGLLERPDPEVDMDAGENRGRVLVRKRGFSCNFRDRGTILEVARFAPPSACYDIGSEFVGEVVAVGEGVDEPRVGSRVIGDYAFPQERRGGPASGVPSNHCSLGLEVFDAGRLVAIPAAMPDEVAAGFTIGAQTSYSMVRRLDLVAGESVLVTAARSNTSLFVIQALRKRGVRVFATTSSGLDQARRLRALGVERVFGLADGASSFNEIGEIRDCATELEGFDAIVDPFFDLHLARAVSVLATGGRYVTCGFLDQAPHVEPHRLAPELGDLRAVVQALMLKNGRLLGNCIGTHADLVAALDDYCAGALEVTIDSVHREPAVAAWFRRTFACRDRLGKTPFLYAA